MRFSKYIHSRLIKIYKNKSYGLHEPCFSNLEMKEIKKCIDSTFVSTAGYNTKKFEEKIKNVTKSKYCVAVVNATTGIFVSLKVLGVKKGDEVLVPTLTFIGSVNPISYCGATPHFIDLSVNNNFIDINYDKLDTYLSSIVKFKNGNSINKNTGNTIKAIVPVHLFGHPSDMSKCLLLAKKYRLKIVEDCAEALGSIFKKTHVGNFGSTGVISFNGNKIITTGGGGAIITNSKKLYKKINYICSTAKIIKDHKIFHTEVGYNYKMPSLNASLGLAQISKLSFFLKKKRSLFKKLYSIFRTDKDTQILREPLGSISNYWLQTLILNQKNRKNQRQIIKYLNNKGILARPPWQPIHTLKPYKKCPKMPLKNSLKISSSLIHVPSGASVI
jgi:perosamine synthetase